MLAGIQRLKKKYSPALLLFKELIMQEKKKKQKRKPLFCAIVWMLMGKKDNKENAFRIYIGHHLNMFWRSWLLLTFNLILWYITYISAYIYIYVDIYINESIFVSIPTSETKAPSLVIPYNVKMILLGHYSRNT